MSITKKIKNAIEDLRNSFHCEACGRKCDNREEAKYKIYLEKWYEDDAKSATEVKLCHECAASTVEVVKKAKAFAAMKKKNLEMDPNNPEKPYHFDS